MAMNLYEIFEEKAKNQPKKKAILYGKTKISYKELKERVDWFAKYLYTEGIGPGDKVALLLKNCPEFVISFFAILKLGAVVVPINFLLKEEEISFILQDSDSKILLSWDSDFSSVLNPLRDKLDLFIKVVTFEEVYKAKKSKEFLDSTYYTSQAIESRSIEDIATLIYTSGTTGVPKGVMLTHKNFIANVRSSLKAISVKASDNMYCFLPLFHSFALTVCLFLPIFVGARITMRTGVKPIRQFLGTIIKKRVTLFVGIPAVYTALLRLPTLLARIIFVFVRLSVSGADALSAEVLEKFQKKLKIPLLEGYGLTEASPVVSLNPLNGVKKPGTVGLPIPDVEVKVVDDEGVELDRNCPGELLVRGENVMKGYYKQPESTHQAFLNGWLRTGDYATIDDDGYIKIVDRKKDLIICKGLNIYPREIETVLQSHQCLVEAAVVGERTRDGHEFPKAFVVLREGALITKAEIIRHCSKYLASYKIPRKIEFMEDLPKNPLGKIEKKRLREWA